MGNQERCTTCATPLDGEGTCVTCAAAREGLRVLARQPYAQARELMNLLEEQGVDAEMERVPPATPEERAQPRWNLYAPEAQLEQALGFLRQDWSSLLEDPAAMAAAARGAAGIDVDGGGEIDCPACGHRFQLDPARAECPECGLALGAPEGAAAGPV